MGDEIEEIKIQTEDGEKVLKTEDVKSLFDEHSELKKEAEGVSTFNKTLEKYGTDQETYLTNAEAAFGVMSELIEKGLIDEKGNVIEKKAGGDPSKDKGDEDPLAFLNFDKNETDKGDKVALLVAKVVETKLGSLAKKVDDLSSGQAGLYRAQLKFAVQGKYSSFSDDDVSKLFGIASANPAKDLWAHAEEMARGKDVTSKGEREKYAKEFGVNLEEFNQNKLNEQSADGGSIPALEGKKLVFGPRAKRLGTKDSVTPREAMILHMKAVHKKE